jgi:hypothetical protein
MRGWLELQLDEGERRRNWSSVWGKNEEAKRVLPALWSSSYRRWCEGDVV